MRKIIFYSLFFILVIVGFILYSLFFIPNSSGENPIQSFLDVIIPAEKGANVASVLEFSGTRYENVQFGFSFEKPNGYNIGEFDEGEKKVILVQSNDSKTSFQILISFLGVPDAVITKNIIQTEIPGIKVENEKEILVDGANGLIFESDNEFFNGASIEAWFMNSGNLYQISGYSEATLIIEELIKTWKWRE